MEKLMASKGMIIFLSFVFLLFIYMYKDGQFFQSTTLDLTPSSSQSSQASQTKKSVTTKQEIKGAASEPVTTGASPFVGMVRISKIKNQGTFAATEYLVLESSNLDNPINITGWRLRSDITGNYATIPSGVTIPQFSLPGPILVSDYEDLIVLTGSSKIDTSFKMNLCTGYFEVEHNFTPELYLACPLVRAEGISENLKDNEECYDFVKSIERCEEPREQAVKDLPKSCETFVANTANYESCVAHHQYDTKFYDNEWRIFLDVRTALWRKSHDTIRLLDSSGRTVDVYSY